MLSHLIDFVSDAFYTTMLCARRPAAESSQKARISTLDYECDFGTKCVLSSERAARWAVGEGEGRAAVNGRVWNLVEVAKGAEL
jgi:hypothetical protein